MHDLNPYQSPELLADEAIDQASELYASGGCWHDGTYLVTTLQSRLPPRCVQYNDEAVEYEKIQLTWYPSWTLFTLLLGPLFLVTLALVGRQISVEVPKGKTLLRRVAIGARWTWGFILTGIALALGGYVALFDSHEARSLCVLAGMIILIVGVVIGIYTSKKLYVRYANDRFVWLQGAGTDFLAALPPWPMKRPWI